MKYLTTLFLLLTTFGGQSSHAAFKDNQCKIDADCSRFGDNLKCGPRAYTCGKKCEAIQMVCYLPAKPPKIVAPQKTKPEEPLNLYKSVD